MGATLLQYAPVSVKNHHNIWWWTVELLGASKPEPEMVFEEYMPSQECKILVQFDHKRLSANTFCALTSYITTGIVHASQCTVLIAFWIAKTVSAYSWPAQSWTHDVKGLRVWELLGHSLNQWEHLVKGHSQTWEHRQRQFTYVTLTSFKCWQLQGKDLYLEIISFGVFGEPWASERDEQFFLYYWIVIATFLRFKATLFAAA